MAFDKDAFLTALDSMSVMELNELVKAIEEKFGVSAAAMAAPAAAGAAAGGAAADRVLGLQHRRLRPPLADAAPRAPPGGSSPSRPLLTTRRQARACKAAPRRPRIPQRMCPQAPGVRLRDHCL